MEEEELRVQGQTERVLVPEAAPGRWLGLLEVAGETSGSGWKGRTLSEIMFGITASLLVKYILNKITRILVTI